MVRPFYLFNAVCLMFCTPSHEARREQFGHARPGPRCTGTADTQWCRGVWSAFQRRTHTMLTAPAPFNSWLILCVIVFLMELGEIP